MNVTVGESNGVAVLAPQGRIMGEPESTELHERVRENVKSGRLQMVVDLSGVEWMNSRGLGFLIAALTTATAGGGSLRLARVSPKVRQLLGIVGLASTFEIFDTVDEAARTGTAKKRS
jgi:anti-anti-sigma factor